MTKKEKIAVGSAFIGALAIDTVVTFRYATLRQLKIDQEVMTEEFNKFLEEELPELLRAEREAMMAKDKPNIEYFTNLYKGKLFENEGNSEVENEDDSEVELGMVKGSEE